jgi:hypothetical protein
MILRFRQIHSFAEFGRRLPGASPSSNIVSITLHRPASFLAIATAETILAMLILIVSSSSFIQKRKETTSSKKAKEHPNTYI